jgi:hypothetical protein
LAKKYAVSYADVSYPTRLPHHPGYGKQGPLGGITGGRISMLAIVRMYSPEAQLRGDFLYDDGITEFERTRPLTVYVTILRAVLLDGKHLDFGLIVNYTRFKDSTARARRLGMFYGQSLSEANSMVLRSDEEDFELE